MHIFSLIDDFNAADESEMYFTTAIQQEKKIVELVGRNQVRSRQQQLDILHNADLSGLFVSKIDPYPQLAKLVPRLQELDLSNGLLSSWDQVFNLISSRFSCWLIESLDF